MQKTEHYQLNQWEPADRVLRTDFNEDNRKIDAALYTIVPQGSILLWSGNESTIPTGWAICDGNHGTPDLRDRFIVGAGTAAYPVHSTGGIASENLKQYSDTTGTVVSSFYAYSTKTRNTRPPYYALYYIMKL